jgi:ribosomal protein S18 acetylase RimI-like enzyme
MQIHLATPAHLEVVAPLFDRYRQFYGQPASPDVAREFISERLARRDSAIFVAQRGEEGLGFVQLYPVFASTAARPGRLWLLNDLYVSVAARGAGVGRALMERARRHAQDSRSTGIFLQTARDNLPAQRLYEALGYRRDEQFLVYELPLT